ncbi:MAG: ATP-binding cassette domain-containing protein, partial [Pseudomonadota bacterium]|nr:ATP-binding cassette domain-containing protein [Pseudomonadota bacterium]
MPHYTVPTSPAAWLSVTDLSVRYVDQLVVDHVSFGLAQGEIGCLLGASGCGKTTILRALAGLEPISHGEIRLHDQVLSCAAHVVPPQQRQMGMVFQDYALFPHLNVTENIQFGLKGWRKAERQQRA